MTEILTMLRERAEQYEKQYALAAAIDFQMVGGERISIGDTQLTIHHLLTMKSGLMVHLYNIVESVMSRIRTMLGSAFGEVPPSAWSQIARREWLRSHKAFDTMENEQARIAHVDWVSCRLIAGTPPKTKYLAKPKGNWSDELILSFAKGLDMELEMQPDLHRKMAKRPDLGGFTPMTFLARRRNDLAHGSRSFEDAQDLTLARIREITDVSLEFMEFVVISFQQYVDQKRFLATP